MIDKKGKDISLDFDIEENRQRIKGNLSLLDDEIYKGKGKIKAENINLPVLLNDPSLKGSVNGDFSFEGIFKNSEDYRVRLEAGLYNSEFMERKLSASKISAELKNGGLRSDIFLSGDFGEVNVKSIIERFSHPPAYSFQSTLTDVNLAKALLTDSLDSRFESYNNRIRQRSSTPDIHFGQHQVLSDKASTFQKYKVDSLFIEARKEPGRSA